MFTEYISWGGFAIIMVASFFGGFLDSIAGGGGLIVLPAFMITGLPMHYVYGCTKFSAALGTTTAAMRYLKHRMIDLRVAGISAFGAFLAAMWASKVVIYLSNHTLEMIMIVVLPVAAAISLLNLDNMGDENLSHTHSSKKRMISAFLIGIGIGLYDGFAGPGTGTFALMAFCLVMNFDMRTATGNAKCLNLAANYAALVVFLMNGTVLFSIAIPSMLLCVLGNYLGAGFAIKKGAKTIRKALMVVIVLLFIKVVVDMILYR